MDNPNPSADDLLRGVGLTPSADPEGGTGAVVPSAPAAPPASDPPATPAAEPDDDDEEIVVPEGADNPDAVRNAIKAERAAARKANAKARELEAELRERDEAQVPLEEKSAQANVERDAANLRALKFEVAAEAGLDLKLAPRLQGSTKEELLADAESLKGFVAPAPVVPGPPPEGGFRNTPPAPNDPVQGHNVLLGAILGRQQASRSGSDPLAGLQPAPDED